MGCSTEVIWSQEYLRLGVKRRGCNGLAYTLNYAGLLSISQQVLWSSSALFLLVVFDQGGDLQTAWGNLMR